MELVAEQPTGYWERTRLRPERVGRAVEWLHELSRGASRATTGTERAVHWVHATAFTILLASGLCLYLPSLAEAVGRRPR